LADAQRIRAVARRVAAAKKQGDDVVVVVSAMGHTTDELVELAGEIGTRPHPRELDMLLTAGERISMALTAMAIEEEGVKAMSLTGSQAGILTDAAHGRARIVDVKGDRVREGLDEDKVVIVAGFQGVDPDTKEITTLGRGGSDATAVALAATLGADVAEIYTDVDGVLTADPRLVPNAKKIDEITYDSMLELASAGVGVLMARSVEFGRRFNVPIHVRSSFHNEPGTWVRKETMEQAIVSGVGFDDSVAKITVHGVPDQPGVAASLFGPLGAEGVAVDMIVQNVSIDGRSDISFTVPKDATTVATKLAESAASQLGAAGVDVDDKIARISLVGAGLEFDSGIAARMFATLAANDINIEMISTSPIRVSCVIKGPAMADSVQALHDEFELAK